MMKLLTENWLSAAVGIYLLAMVLYGHYKGFIRQSVSLVALIATLVIANLSMPYVADFLAENTPIRRTIEDGVRKTFGIVGAQVEREMLPSAQEAMIESLNLPDQLKKALIENNNDAIYESLGVNAFADYLGRYLTDMVIKTIGFVLLFLLIYIGIHLIMRWLDIIAKLPILYGINKIAGALLGAVEGVIFLWILFLIATACAGTSWGGAVMGQIEASPWLSFLYNHNFLNHVVLGMFHSSFLK